MAEAFFGPWTVAVTAADTVPSFRFAIIGSDGADGLYEADSAHLLAPTVTGAEWTLELHYRAVYGLPWRLVTQVRRTTEFVPSRGLTVRLDARPLEPSGTGAPQPYRLTLICTSRDPAINPIPSGRLPDFSVPPPRLSEV